MRCELARLCINFGYQCRYASNSELLKRVVEREPKELSIQPVRHRSGNMHADRSTIEVVIDHPRDKLPVSLQPDGRGGGPLPHPHPIRNPLPNPLGVAYDGPQRIAPGSMTRSVASQSTLNPWLTA